MSTSTDTKTSLQALPADCPFGTGPRFEVVVRADVKSFHGNVACTSGRYEAQQSTDAPEGVVTVWSPNHYAAGDRGGIYMSLAACDWTFPGEAKRPIPEHDCSEHLRSGVAGGIFCGVCKAEVAS